MKVDGLVIPGPELPPGFYEAPYRFRGGADGRLVKELRDAAATMDPQEILARAAVAHYRSESGPTYLDREADSALGNALADLAVTGREAYGSFKGGVDVSELEDEVRSRLAAEENPPSPAQVTSAVDKALDRAYAVAWALRGPASRRPALRAPLGWVAVSSEDDKPHRPVNVPGPPYEQFELEVAAGGVSVATRLFIASAGVALAPGSVPTKRTTPVDPEPEIPGDHEVLVFLHGHSSGAEEALGFIPHLLEEGLRRGKKYTVVAFDLPNNGYSETFHHKQVAGGIDTTYPDLPTDTGPIRVPILDFLEDFVVAFVNKLKVTGALTAFIGGSLGGSLGLRLGRRDASKDPWLSSCSIVAWSPASVWMPMVADAVKRLAPGECVRKYGEDEQVPSRQGYFRDVYEKSPLPGIIFPQPEYWYRKGYEYKSLNIWMSRIARGEIYTMNYRQWHWRVAAEQLIYSHFDRTDRQDETTPPRYEGNTLRLLLAAGQKDNYTGTNIFDNTLTLGRLMVNTPGRLLPVEDSGHSLHFERPRYFARELVAFLNARSMQVTGVTRQDGRIRRLQGTNVSEGGSFDLSLDECLFAILDGDEFFVDDDGEKTWVRIRRPGRREAGRPRTGYHLATSPNDTEQDNLRSLG